MQFQIFLVTFFVPDFFLTLPHNMKMQISPSYEELLYQFTTEQQSTAIASN